MKERPAEEKEKREQADEAEDEADAAYDEAECYRQMTVLVRPKETVARALMRFGGGKKSSAQRLKEKKRIKEGKETDEDKKSREDMTTLTGLADSVLTRSGHMEIYEETYESMTFKMKKMDEKKKSSAKAVVIPEGTDDDDALDMFMDTSTKEKGGKQDEMAEKKEVVEKVNLDYAVQWEFRWENEDASEVHGPHGTGEMIKWQESGFFDKGVFVRKVGAKDFNDVKRVDFDLYT